MPREKIIARDAEHDLVQREDGLHLFDESLVRKKPAPKKPIVRRSSNVVIDDRANGVQFVLKNGKVTLVED